MRLQFPHNLIHPLYPPIFDYLQPNVNLLELGVCIVEKLSQERLIKRGAHGALKGMFGGNFKVHNSKGKSVLHFCPYGFLGINAKPDLDF